MHRMIGTALVVAVMGAAGGAVASVTVTPLDDGKAAAPSTPGTNASPSSPAGATSQPADATANLDYVNGLMDGGKYKEALQLLARLYETPAVDKPALLMMRGECQLQIHEMGSAVSTLQQASRDANTANNTVEANQAAAFAFLIQKSAPKNVYTPVNSPEKTPIDILDRTKRKLAYQALLQDEVVVLQAKVRAATTSGTLPPFLEIARDVPALKGIERNANGGTKQSDQFAKDAANSAAKVITNALSDMDQQISQISVLAEHLVDTGPGGQVGPTFRTGVMQSTTGGLQHQGLTGDSVTRLQNIQSTCAKIPLAVQELSKAFENPEPFFHLATHAQTTGQRAYQVQTKDYTRP